MFEEEEEEEQISSRRTWKAIKVQFTGLMSKDFQLEKTLQKMKKKKF